MKRLLAIPLVLGLAACAGSPTRDGGVAGYDALKAARDACMAKGQVLRLKRGGNSQYIDDYACEKE